MFNELLFVFCVSNITGFDGSEGIGGGCALRGGLAVVVEFIVVAAVAAAVGDGGCATTKKQTVKFEIEID